jgi:hypothetical protein
MVQGDELVGVGTVLESPDHGPQLCLGMVMASLPPQCGGPPIPNWDWSAVTGHTTLHGTTWGDYEVVGTYDGHQFTLTREPTPRAEGTGTDRRHPEDYAPPCTPCPEPAGGWRVLDPALTTDRHMEKTFRKARRLDGYAGAWLDQSINPASHSDDEDAALLMNDPKKLIINIAVTSDPATAERKLRKTWGGALCVSLARHTAAELDAVLDAVCNGVSGNRLSAHAGHDHVHLEVIYDDGSLQADLDRRYGAGLVLVTSALRPHTS